MSISSIAQSERCYNSKEKLLIAKKLNELIYVKKSNQNLSSQIFELESKLLSKEVTITTFKQKVSKLEKLNNNYTLLLSNLKIENKNNLERLKIQKKKRVKIFIKGSLIGAGTFVIIKFLTYK